MEDCTRWPSGPMARRLTTNQKIVGSNPILVILFFLNSILIKDFSTMEFFFPFCFILPLLIYTSNGGDDK
ncbi:hypothetical protein F5X96DRAFT_624339 [Biscogniauxia mediterranea]|nr:hypothetical protein F5X96DRAFT_624339 [Biscogniauxia mediterranea]